MAEEILKMSCTMHRLCVLQTSVSSSKMYWTSLSLESTSRPWLLSCYRAEWGHCSRPSGLQAQCIYYLTWTEKAVYPRLCVKQNPLWRPYTQFRNFSFLNNKACREWKDTFSQQFQQRPPVKRADLKITSGCSFCLRDWTPRIFTGDPQMF